MAAIEQALRDYLAGNGTISDIVGDRVRCHKAEQQLMRPFVVVELTDSEPGFHSTGGDRLNESFLRVHCEGTRYRQARELSEAIHNLFEDGFQGPLGFGENAVDVRHLFLRGTRPRPYTGDRGSEDGQPAIIVDLEVMHK